MRGAHGSALCAARGQAPRQSNLGEPPLDPDEFAALTGVSSDTLARLQAYAGLLKTWSARINLVASSTLNDPWRRHFLDSAQLFALIPPTADSLIDLGSGAGFPGLVLAVMGVPGVELVEADARKCAFLREAARVSGATVTIHNVRIEAVPPRPVAVVSARGCAPLDQLLSYSQRFIGPETVCLFPKGAQAGQEVALAQQQWEFDAATHPSRTDPRGVILCLSRVRRRAPGSGN